jgi:hypothetical protein
LIYTENYYESDVTTHTSLELNLTTLSAEAHARFYPFGNTFFLGGMLGYGNLMMGISGDRMVNGQKDTVSLNALRDYAKLGARIGWRIDFGSPGGFAFEPSFGHDFAIGFGDTFGKRLNDALNSDIESYALVGGPRVTLGFGWRF